MHKFPKFTPAWISTCFGQFLCPSSGVYSLYTRHCYTYVVQVWRQISSRTCRSYSKAVFKIGNFGNYSVYQLSRCNIQWYLKHKVTLLWECKLRIPNKTLLTSPKSQHVDSAKFSVDFREYLIQNANKFSPNIKQWRKLRETELTAHL